MSSESVFMIRGRKLVLPATPEMVEFKWEKMIEHGKGSAKGKKDPETSHPPAKAQKPVKKRFRRKKIPKS
ncbi:MAG: hypothetical protein ACMUHM_07720 [Thermoplasmatota archaeon]